MVVACLSASFPASRMLAASLLQLQHERWFPGFSGSDDNVGPWMSAGRHVTGQPCSASATCPAASQEGGRMMAQDQIPQHTILPYEQARRDFKWDVSEDY